MAFNDEECVQFPLKVGMHTWDGVDWDPWDGVLNTGDIEMGAVEIKNATTDDRAIVSTTGQLSVHETDDQTFAAATGAAAVSMTVTPGVAAEIEQVMIHLSAAGGAGNLTITIDNGTGAAYDTVVLTQDMTAVIDLPWIPPKALRLKATDSLVIAWANAGTKTYGIEVCWSKH
jgi:hypothetical protein